MLRRRYVEVRGSDHSDSEPLVIFIEPVESKISDYYQEILRVAAQQAVTIDKQQTT